MCYAYMAPRMLLNSDHVVNYGTMEPENNKTYPN
jgi:hypothetical protein